MGAIGKLRSPYVWADRTRWFAEPPGRTASMVWLSDDEVREAMAAGQRLPRSATSGCAAPTSTWHRSTVSSASTDLTLPPDAASPPSEQQPVQPTHDDPDVAAASTVIGGPVGDRGRQGYSWWGPVRVAVLVAVVGYSLAVLARMPCVSSGFAGISRYTHMCYSDIPVLYHLRGFADGYLPYLDSAPDLHPFEYPVLTGAMAQLAAWLTPLFGGGAIGFYAANVVLIGALLVVTVWATALAAGGARGTECWWLVHQPCC